MFKANVNPPCIIAEWFVLYEQNVYGQHNHIQKSNNSPSLYLCMHYATIKINFNAHCVHDVILSHASLREAKINYTADERNTSNKWWVYHHNRFDHKEFNYNRFNAVTNRSLYLWWPYYWAISVFEAAGKVLHCKPIYPLSCSLQFLTNLILDKSLSNHLDCLIWIGQHSEGDECNYAYWHWDSEDNYC